MSTIPGDHTPHGVSPQTPARRPRSKLVVVVGVLIVLALIAAVRMYLDSVRLDKLNKSMPGLSDRRPVPAPTTYTEPKLGYSLVLPSGWEPVERPGKPIAFIGDKINGSTPNLQVTQEAFQGDLAAYEAANLATFEQGYKDYKLLEQGSITTRDGLVGRRCLVEHTMSEKKFRQIYYFLPKSSGLYIVACASLSIQPGTNLDSTFDECIKSIRLTP